METVRKFSGGFLWIVLFLFFICVSVFANEAPMVDAGEDSEICLSGGIASIQIDATVTDDGLPNPPGNVSLLWTVDDGTGLPVFNPSDDVEDPEVTFDTPGDYVLRLTADDGNLSDYDTVKVTVYPEGCFDFKISQVSVKLDDANYPESEWGRLELLCPYSESVMYFNLTVNGSWQVENLPVVNSDESGLPRKIACYFDLGNARGENVSDVNCGWSFTPDVVSSGPAEAYVAPVDDYGVAIYGRIAGNGGAALSSGERLEAGKIIDWVEHNNLRNFPNFQSDKRACVPTAVANSLEYLNSERGLGINAEKISPDKMKDACGYNPAKGCDEDWDKDKDKYMRANGIPITTRVETDVSKIAKEIEEEQDVEYNFFYSGPDPNDPTKKSTGGHTVTVTGAGKIVDDNNDVIGYAVEFVHDANQDDPNNGLETCLVRVDPNGKVVFPPFEITKSWAVVECPDPNWFDRATVRIDWEIDPNTREPRQDANSPYNRGSGTASVEEIGEGIYEYIFDVNNTPDPNQIKKLCVEYIYNLAGGISQNVFYLGVTSPDEDSTNWKMVSKKRLDLGKDSENDDVWVQVIYEGDPQPSKESLKWWIFDDSQLKEIRVFAICVPKPTACEQAKAKGENLKGDVTGDCRVDFYDVAVVANDWLDKIEDE